jgi:hypothetical protein
MYGSHSRCVVLCSDAAFGMLRAGPKLPNGLFWFSQTVRRAPTWYMVHGARCVSAATATPGRYLRQNLKSRPLLSC